MSLIKRSVILYKDTTKGMLTVIRLGETVGAKLSLNEKPAGELWLGVKMGNGQQQNFRITEQQTEIKPDCDLSMNDTIGAILIYPDGTVYAYGGTKEKVSVILIKEAQISLSLPTVEAAAPSGETATPEVKAGEKTEIPVAAQEVSKATETVEASAPVEPVTTAADNPKPSQNTVRFDQRTPTGTRPHTEDIPERPAPRQEREEEAKESFENEANMFDRQQQEGENKKRNPFDIPKAKNFYQAVRGRLEEIMTINPKEEDLERLIPDSEWVKVRYDGEEYYVVGRMYENNLVTYLGYGVPGVESVRPPKEAEELCDFLPVKNGVGYWLMFQKADDGSITKEIQ